MGPLMLTLFKEGEPCPVSIGSIPTHLAVEADVSLDVA